MTTSTSALIRANDIDIHYVEAGSPDSPDLILLHGGLVSTNEIWDQTPVSYGPYVDALADRFHVIAPDVRGSGRSGNSDVHLSISLFADDVAAIIERLGLRSPAVAGFSLGGIIATVLGIRHPGVAGAIVNDAGYDMLDPEAPSYAMLRQAMGGSPEATAADPDAAAAFFAADPEMAPVFELMKADQDAGGGAGGWRGYLERFFEAASTWPGFGFADLAGIDVPTLVLVGDRDHFCPVEQGATTYRHLARGELAVLPDTGHVITPEKIAVLSAFLGRVGR
jgi:pimeloyl-ACP methyl ester carboxylesterase